MLFVILAILIFGVLIATHELGHFLTAKLFGVKVNEFAIGMGPALFKWGKGETLYSFRAFPIGGYCAMEGEDDDSADPRSFGKAAGWKKLIILCAGAAMNFLTGVLIFLVIYAQFSAFAMPVIGGLMEGYGLEDCGLQAGDKVISVDGHRMYGYSNLSFFLGRAGDKVDWVVERDGERIKLNDVYMPIQEKTDEAGNTTRLRGLTIGTEVLPGTIGNKLLFGWYAALDNVRLVWISLGDLVSGAVGLRDLSGPVGIVDVMTEVGSNPEYSPNAAAAAINMANFAGLIAVNLAVMNLLPLPALDGGRVFFLVLNGILNALFKRKIDAKYEGYVHLAGLAMLMGLMLMVTFSDIGKLFGK